MDTLPLTLTSMKPAIAALAAWLVLIASPASAHPVPFSYLDIRLGPGSLDVTLVAHIFDVAHDLQLEPPELLLEAPQLAAREAAIRAMLAARVRITVDDQMLPPPAWQTAEPLVERQSLRLHASVPLRNAPGVVSIEALLFPYDPAHETFVNVYEADDLRLQAILDTGKARMEYYAGSRQGVAAVIRKFVPTGFEHILIGPDHLLFLAGLLLLGGSVRRLAVIVSAFTVAHSLTLSLATLQILQPPARLIEPAIALSIVYVGADNLMVHGGRDVRTWIAFGFGFIHGFGFANVLSAMDLPARALGWSLLSFNLGVELGQLLIVLILGSAIVAGHARYPAAGRRFASIGSIIVIVAGAYWFIARVFFPGGIA
jgi:hypothetical protein